MRGQDAVAARVGLGGSRWSATTQWFSVLLVAVILGTLVGLVGGTAALAAALLSALTLFFARYPAPLFAFFLYIGVFKSEPVVQDLPLDITAITAVILTAACGLSLLRRSAHPIPGPLAAAFAVLATWMALSLTWAPPTVYGSEKTLYFLTLTLLATFGPIMLFRDRGNLQQFLWTLVALAAGAGLITLLSVSGAPAGRLGFGEAGETISTARLLGTAALVLALLPTRSLRARLVLSSMSAIFLVGVFAIGTRGAAIAVVLALGIALGVRALQRRAQSGTVISVAVGVAVVGAVLLYAQLPAVSAERITQVYTQPGVAFVGSHRQPYFTEAVALTKAHPWRGVGVGGYSTFQGILPKDPVYAHNVFLELSAELGLVAAVAFALFLLITLARLYRYATSALRDRAELAQLCGGLLLFSLFAAQFSSDINGNRALWAFLGLSWLLITRPDFALPRPRSSS